MTCEDEKYKEHLEKINEKCWSNSDFRIRTIEKNKARSKTRVVCSEWNDEFAYGSMFAHKKRCRGIDGISSLEMLLILG